MQDATTATLAFVLTFGSLLAYGVRLGLRARTLQARLDAQDPARSTLSDGSGAPGAPGATAKGKKAPGKGGLP